MAQNFVNTYSPMTPIGAAMQNISLAMFGGRTPRDEATDEARIASALASAEAGRARAARDDAERRLTESLITRRTPDEIDQDVTFRSGLPLPRVRAIRSHLLDGAELPGDISPAEVQRVGQFYFSHRGGLADKTYSPEGVERGIRTGLETSEWTAALADPRRVQPFARAQNAREGRGELAASTGINTFTGDAASPLARAVIGLRQGQTNQANAAAGASGALTRQRDLETRTGVRIGAPVLVDDPEIGPTYAPPSAAVGRPPAARPRPEGAPKVQTRRPLTRDQMAQMTAAIESLAGAKGDSLDPATRARITSRATQLATDPESDYHQDPAGAAEAAIAEIAPQGFERPGVYGFRGPARPKGVQPAPQQPTAPAAQERKTVGGKNYVKVNGQWFEE